MVQMLNALTFIINEHDSDARIRNNSHLHIAVVSRSSLYSRLEGLEVDLISFN